MLNSHPRACLVRLVMQAFIVPCSSSLYFLIQMLPYFSSPLHSVFISLRVGSNTCHLTKWRQNRKKKKCGGKTGAQELGQLSPAPHWSSLSGFGVKKTYSRIFSHAPTKVQQQMFSSSSCLAMGTQELTKKNYLAPWRMALSVSVLKGA